MTDPSDEVERERVDRAVRVTTQIDQIVAASITDIETAAAIELACANGSTAAERLVAQGVPASGALGLIVSAVAVRVAAKLGLPGAVT